MATLQNNIEGLKSDVVSNVKNFANTLKDNFSGIVGNASTQIEGFFTGDVVGINIEYIPTMQQAIRDYVSNIDSHLNEVKRNADTTQAFKGDFDTAIHEYVDAVCDACGALTSQLLKFNETLEEVKTKYQAHSEDVQSQLSSQASEVNSSFQRYTE